MRTPQKVMDVGRLNEFTKGVLFNYEEGVEKIYQRYLEKGKEGSSAMKLHLGCGEKYLPGYKHMDVRGGSHIDYIGNAENLEMFEDESIEELYACHLLEHIKRANLLDVLREWNRVLIPGGILRIAVPDFESIVKVYLKDGNLSQLMGLLYGGQNYEYNFHYQTFDLAFIKEKLESVGFTDVKRYDWKEFIPGGGYDDFSKAYLPHMDTSGQLMSLNITATKVKMI